MLSVDQLLIFWESELFHGRYLMSPSTIVLVEETIKLLKELKQLKGGTL